MRERLLIQYATTNPLSSLSSLPIQKTTQCLPQRPFIAPYANPRKGAKTLKNQTPCRRLPTSRNRPKPLSHLQSAAAHVGERNLLSNNMEETTFKWDGGLLLDCLSRMRFRLKASARHRLALDIAALCTGLRAVVMVDYAREVSQMQNQLSKLLNILAQEIRLISFIKVMCMDDIVYLTHVENLCVLMDETLKHSIKLEFVVLDDAEVRFALPMEKEEALNHFASFKNGFLLQVSRGMESSESFPHSGKDFPKANVADITHGSVPLETGSQSIIAHTSSSSIGLIDLGSSETCCEAALPTLNGWLLGYPVIYLFKKENISKAVRTLSVSALHHYKLLIQSSLSFQTSEAQGQKVRPVMHELTSFTVPSELSTQGVGEEWASAFMQSMQINVKNSQLWKSLELQVTSQICQSVVL